MAIVPMGVALVMKHIMPNKSKVRNLERIVIWNGLYLKGNFRKITDKFKAFIFVLLKCQQI